ncbi:MlaD family protein [Sphingomonas morindae]|uniref:MCE family protein n=1 Tax=Sphingomonas morindae TaxID=1541170 RepID=A0ABY4XBF9_9SPHN|nr:MlaD family protein [Sphingomonas morindae]USI74091.1 MCE family protein [Sphingomonas morindae]
METRSNHVLVGGVVLAIIAVAVVFIVWMAQIGNGHQQKYDIFFPNSVEGLAKGSAVTFSGVPVGKIDDIKLMPDSPQLVRVRISVDDSTPILQGTTATISGVGFTGVSQINLAGAIKGAAPITAIGPFGAPVIPTKPGLVGQLLNSAPQLLDKLSTLTQRLGDLLDDRNQNSIHHILENIDKVTSDLAAGSPQLRQTIASANLAIQQAGHAADEIAKVATTTNSVMDGDVRQSMAELRQTIASAHHTAGEIDKLVADAKPGVTQLTTETAPNINRLVRDLSEMADALTATANRLNNSGAGGVLGGNRLPVYKGK